MKPSYSFLIILSILLKLTICDSLVFVQELFRHGARGPLSKYWDYKESEEIKGELTPAGYRQQYILGKQLRTEYIEQQTFLSKTYNWKQIYVRSTDVNRTIMSANAQLLGLYPEGFSLPTQLEPKYRIPPYKGAQDDTSLGDKALPNNSMVFPVHVRHEMDDIELQPWNRCDDYVNQVKLFQDNNKAIIDQFNKDHDAIYKRLTTLLNQNINTFTQIGGVWGGLYDVFISDIYQKRSLPDGLTEQELEEIRYMDSFSWFFGDVGTDLGVKQLITPFLNLLIQNFDNKINGKTPDLKWMMYSAHDSNVILSMRALNISNYQCVMDLWNKKSTSALNCHYRPEFASSLIWELFKKDNLEEYAIKIKFNGEYVKLCEKDQIQCDYTEFKSRIQNYVLPDFEKGCKNKLVETKKQESANQPSWNYLLKANILFIILFLMISI